MVIPRSFSSGALSIWSKDFTSERPALASTVARYVSRVIAVAGDTVDITPEGKLRVNGSTMLETNIFFETYPFEGFTAYPITPQTIAVETPAPFVFGDHPEQLLVDLTGLDRPAETALPVGDTQKDATLVSGSFGLRGGPDFSLYLDAKNFQLIENEGRCYFCPVDDAGNLYLEIAYHPGGSAETLSTSILWDYGIIIQATDVQQTDLNGQSALYLTGKTMETQYEACLIECDGGCVSLVLCAPGGDTTVKHQTLAASMQTFLLQK